MKKIYLLSILLLSLAFYSCELLGLEDEEELEEVAAAVNPGYNFTFTCPAGSTNTVPIPAASKECQEAYEYFAEVYGCNESDYFNSANCMMCTECDLQNYCTVCQ